MKTPLLAPAGAAAIIACIAFFIISQGGAYAKGNAPAAISNNTAANNTAEADDKTPFSSQGYSIFIGAAKYGLLEKEDTSLTINVTSPASTRARIRYYGLKNNMGSWRINHAFDADLAEGFNNLSVNISMPSCSSCSGLDEGAYNIYGAVYVHGDEVANASAEIMFLKDG